MDRILKQINEFTESLSSVQKPPQTSKRNFISLPFIYPLYITWKAKHSLSLLQKGVYRRKEEDTQIKKTGSAGM